MGWRFWAWLVVAGCGGDLRFADGNGEIVPAAYVQPRLVTVGSAGAIDYDADGYPRAMTALYRQFTFTWAAGQLVSVTGTFQGFDLDHTVMATLTYSNEQLTAIHTSCTGACEGLTDRTDRFSYDARGSLATWTTTGNHVDVRSYAYDERGRLLTATSTKGSTTLSYGLDDGCPTFDGAYMASFKYAFGHLTSFGPYEVSYDAAGHISAFASTGPAFRDLLYMDGEARGLDVWPGFYNGGYVYGFPADGELLRLDGSCDPTLRSQPVILGMAVGSLL